MALLLISGLGPFRSHSEHLNGTLLGRDLDGNVELQRLYAQMAGRPVDLRRFSYGTNGDALPLLRPRGQREPCLSTMTLQSILDAHQVDYDAIDIEDVWYEEGQPPRARYDVIALSTTFLCRRKHLRQMVRWVAERYPDATVIVGGQYAT
ncbi:MAG: hypothetical protein R2712_28435 [Vicinamibacterales bacterium]